MRKPQRYMLIDDDPTSNLIGEFVIKSCDSDAVIESYVDPEVALSEIEKKYGECEDLPETLLFLDLNMPNMSGWDFLEVFEEFHEDVRKSFRVNILTSSIEDFSTDKVRFPFVSGFISKPLKKEKMREILEGWTSVQKKKTGS